MQSTGHTSMHASQPVQLSALTTASALGSFLRAFPAPLAMMVILASDLESTAILQRTLTKKQPAPGVLACGLALTWLTWRHANAKPQARIQCPSSVSIGL